jgi:hypothetical protein
VKQTKHLTHHRSALRVLTLAALAVVALPLNLVAADSPQEKTIRLQEFEVSEPRTSAQSMAPTESRLEATQPSRSSTCRPSKTASHPPPTTR